MEAARPRLVQVPRDRLRVEGLTLILRPSLHALSSSSGSPLYDDVRQAMELPTGRRRTLDRGRSGHASSVHCTIMLGALDMSMPGVLDMSMLTLVAVAASAGLVENCVIMSESSWMRL